MQKAWRPIVVAVLVVLVIVIGRALTRDSLLEPGDPVEMEIWFRSRVDEPVDTEQITVAVALFEEGDTLGAPYAMSKPKAWDAESLTLALEYAPGRTYLVMPGSKSYSFQPDRFRINLKESISRKKSHTSFTCEVIPGASPETPQVGDSLATESQLDDAGEPEESPAIENVTTPYQDAVTPIDPVDSSEQAPSRPEDNQLILAETASDDAPVDPEERIGERPLATTDRPEKTETRQPTELEPTKPNVMETEEPIKTNTTTPELPIELETTTEEPTKTNTAAPELPIEPDPESEEQEPTPKAPEVPKAEVELPERTPTLDVVKASAVYEERTGEVEQLFSAGQYTKILAMKNDPPGRDQPDYPQAQALYLKIEEYKGCALMSQRKHQAAVKVFQAILAQTRRAGFAQFNLLICLYQLGRYREVIDEAYPGLQAMRSTISRARLKEVSMKAEFFHAMSYVHLCKEAALEPRAPDCRRATRQLEGFLVRWPQENMGTISEAYLEAAKHHRDQLSTSGR